MKSRRERTSSELQYLQAKFAALMSYGSTLQVLEDILPLNQMLAAASIRRSLHRTCERIAVDSAQHPPAAAISALRASISAPSPVRAIGINRGLRAHP